MSKLAILRVCGTHDDVKLLFAAQVVYLSLAFYRIGNQSLWTDEVISVTRAVVSQGSILSGDIWFGSQCPLYYACLRVWSKIGHSEAVLRSLSVLLGTIALSLTYATALKLFGRRVATISAFLIATSPFFIWYSQEVRYVTLVLTTSLLATYSFFIAIETARLRSWLMYLVSALLAVFSFVSVVFILGVHFGYLCWSRANLRTVLASATCQSLTVLVFAGWFILQYGNPFDTEPAASVEDSAHLSTSKVPTQRKQMEDLVGTVPYTLFTFSTGLSMGPSVRELQISRSLESLLKYFPTLSLIAILFGSVFALGIWELKQRRKEAKYLLLWLGIPMIAALAAVVTFEGVIYNVRYVAAAFPAYAIILAVGISRVRRQIVRVSVLSAVLIVNAISLKQYYFDPQYAREDGRAAAGFLETAVRPGEVIVAVGNVTAVEYYYKGEVQIVGANAQKGGWKSLGSASEVSRKHNRVWLVESRRWESDPAATLRRELADVAVQGEHQRFAGVDVFRFDMFRQY